MFSKTVGILIVCSLGARGCSTQTIEPKKLESKNLRLMLGNTERIGPYV
jgi:hypothetical protein